MAERGGMTISPAPTDDEAAAIVAAVEVLWPRPQVLAATEGADRIPTWRFSGRWWQRGRHSASGRPWR